MANLPALIDPTLHAADAALEQRENARPPRPYLGMSAIGRRCRRELWYQFRWAMKVAFDAKTLKRFEDGHRTEDLQAQRLRLVEGVTLITLDPETGRQIGFSDLDDHFRGHADGVIQGLLQCPTRLCVWEHKATSEDKLKKLQKLIREDEKSALRQWDEVYFAQAVLYMHFSGIPHHYLTCSTPGGRETISVRTDADPAEAARLIEKARQIIHAPEPLERAGESPDSFACRFCDFASLCHGDVWPDRNCRTCLWSEPTQDGLWHCHKHRADLTVQDQRAGCTSHRYVPALVDGEQLDSDPMADWVSYRLRDGRTWVDGV